MGEGFAVNLKKLDVCFGGFTPMALSDGFASQEEIRRSAERLRERHAMLDRIASLEAARTSEERSHVAADGVVWRYVVLDNEQVRVVGCEPGDVTDLLIPEEIEGLPVVALGNDACARLAQVERIVCPESLMSVGLCAFRGCKSLREMRFPSQLAVFDADWLRGCSRLEHLAYPGMAEKIDARLFDTPELRILEIGEGTAIIEPGSFAKSKLEHVTIAEGNQVLSSDGRGIYSKDGSVLVALAVPGETYEVIPQCRAIAKKGLSTFARLKDVALPDGLEVLGEFSFANTGVSSFAAPASLRHILEKAFFNCASLVHVELNEGLETIGANAFTGTGIRELHVSASVCSIENPVAAKTGLVYAGEHATFSIDEASTHLELDEAGGLYGKDADGKRFLLMLDPDATSYTVKDGTVEIADGAFEKHAHLCEVALPEGLVAIGDRAFKGCMELQAADMPETVASIGDEAFMDTALHAIGLPQGLSHLGANALVTYGAHHGGVEPALREVEVAEGSPLFYRAQGLLLERKPSGASRVLLCTGDAETVRIPAEVDEIAPYAFNGVRGVRELYLSDRIQTVGIRGLSLEERLDLVHVDLVEPIEGHTCFDIRFPDTDRGEQQLYLALSVPSFVDVETLFEHYDSSIANASSFDPENRGRLDIYEQAQRIIARLLDPVFLAPVHRNLFDRMLRSEIEDVCVALAKHDDRRSVDALLDLGYLNEENLYRVIDRVGAVQDAAMTNYLLEVKRERFGLHAIDFDL